jgi:hypothetical protein
MKHFILVSSILSLLIGLLSAIPLSASAKNQQADLSGSAKSDEKSESQRLLEKVASNEQIVRMREVRDVYNARIARLETERDAAIKAVLTPGQKEVAEQLSEIHLS